MEFIVDMRMPFSRDALLRMPYHWFAPEDAPLAFVTAYSAHFNMVDAVARFGPRLVATAEADLARWGYNTLEMKRACLTILSEEIAQRLAEQATLRHAFAASVRLEELAVVLHHDLEIDVAAHDRDALAKTILKRTGVDGVRQGHFALWYPTADARITFTVSCRYGRLVACLVRDEAYIVETFEDAATETAVLALVDTYVPRAPAYIDLAAAPFLARAAGAFG